MRETEPGKRERTDREGAGKEEEEELCYIHSHSIKFHKFPIVPSHVHSINDSVSAEQAADDYEFVIRQLVKTRAYKISDCPNFNLILLGMGSYGHVASLFPNHSALDEKDEWITFITDSPKPPPERITFTLPIINSASNVALVMTGNDKAEAVHLATMWGPIAHYCMRG